MSHDRKAPIADPNYIVDINTTALKLCSHSISLSRVSAKMKQRAQFSDRMR
jgi:hypothetical protein